MQTTDGNNDLGVAKGKGSPGTLDVNSDLPIAPSLVEQRARALQGALFYASRQDPDQYARLLRIHELTGIPPAVSAGHEKEIEQALQATRIDPHALTAVAPRVAAWASRPDNAAVAGAREIQRLGGVEQNAAVMRAAVMQAAERHAAMTHARVTDAAGTGATSTRYDVTATNPVTQHQIGTKDGGRSWFDVKTGERVR